jgi:hypothetical protein
MKQMEASRCSAIPNWLFAFLGSAFSMTLWILASWPGSMGNDSQDVWSQVLTGEIRNDHPVANQLWLRVFSLDGNFLGGVLLTQSFLMSLAISRIVSKTLLTQSKMLNLIGGLLTTIVPQVGGLAVSLIKDAPYTIFLLLSISFLLKLVSEKLSNREVFFASFCLLMSSIFRHEAFLVTFIGLALAILFMKFTAKKVSFRFFAPLFISLILSAITQNLLPHILEAKEVSPWLRNSSFLIDVGHIENKHPGTFNKLESDEIRASVSASALETTNNCKNPDAFFFSSDVDLNSYNTLSSDAKRLWLKALIQHPRSLLEFRFCRSYIFFPPIFGLDKGGWWQEWGVEENSNGVPSNAAPLGKLNNLFTSLVHFFEQSKWVFAYPGIFAYIPLLYIVKTRRANQQLGVIVAATISTSTALFAFAWGSAPYYRYTSFALAFSTLLIVLSILKTLDRKFKKIG